MRNVDIFQDKLRIYTLGNENVAPLRFNPFELIPGVRVESHLANLQTCFEGALPPVGPLPSIIAESIETIYRRYGWRLTDYGTTPEEEFRKFPSMEDFYTEVERVVRQRGYQGETKSNLEAAIKGRIKPLLMGSKGKMFSCRLSSPSAETLFKHPVILELNDLNEEDKSLVMMFFLTLLREYRELNTSKELTHITLVEEAHNVLGNVSQNKSEDSSDVKAKSVQAFCNMLAEVRAYGEGLIITDQSPEKLARDAMRNTNVQIAHQLRDAHDREAIANAMIMSEEQRDYLGKCETGRAAVFYTGLQKATFIDVPVYKDKLSSTDFEDFWCGFRDNLSPRLSDVEVREYMAQFSDSRVEKDSNFKSSIDRQLILQLAESSIREFEKAFDSLDSEKSLKNWANFVLKVTEVTDVNDLDIARYYLQEMWFRLQNDEANSNLEEYIDVLKIVISGNNR